MHTHTKIHNVSNLIKVQNEKDMLTVKDETFAPSITEQTPTTAQA